MSKARDESSEQSSPKDRRTGVQRKESAPAELLRDLQEGAGNQAMLQLLGTGAVQRKEKGSEAGAASGPAAAPAAEAAPAKASLIVEDEAKEVGPGQMRKSDFLAKLRPAVCGTAEEALKGTMWSTMGCPHIERWLDHYRKQPSAYLERALRKYAPETASARSAQEYIPLVTQRVRRGIEEWRSTGEVKDLPPEFAAGGMPGATAQGLIGSLLGGAVSAIGGAISSAVSGVGKALSSVGSMLFKRHEGAEAEPAEEPAAIRAQLGSGHALDGATRRRMQSAFGVDFAGVRVHTDARARELSEGMQARAFTVGSDIAFGGDEYQPGTPVGDALIAHELAHVVQQGGDNAAGGAQHKGGSGTGMLEEDADRSAVGAVVKLWTGAHGDLSALGQGAAPNLRSGLRLQRCGGTPKKTESTTPGAAATAVALSGDWAKDVETARKNNDEAMMLALVKKALEPKFTVNLATQTSPDEEHPKDYKKAPTINFDPKLHRKRKYKQTEKVGENPGHSFEAGNDTYANLNRTALDVASSLVTVMYAEHELYHTTHHLGPSVPKPKKPPTTEELEIKEANDELETWTVDFTKYFEQFSAFPRDVRPLFAPLIDYYADAAPEAKTAALEKLKKYYEKPVADSKEAERVQQSMSVWVYRWKKREAKNRKGGPLSKELINDLDKIVKPPKMK